MPGQSSTSVLGSIVVSIPACHAGDPGSIPGRGAISSQLGHSQGLQVAQGPNEAWRSFTGSLGCEPCDRENPTSGHDEDIIYLGSLTRASALGEASTVQAASLEHQLT